MTPLLCWTVNGTVSRNKSPLPSVTFVRVFFFFYHKLGEEKKTTSFPFLFQHFNRTWIGVLQDLRCVPEVYFSHINKC